MEQESIEPQTTREWLIQITSRMESTFSALTLKMETMGEKFATSLNNFADAIKTLEKDRVAQLEQSVAELKKEAAERAGANKWLALSAVVIASIGTIGSFLLYLAKLK